MCLAEAVLSSFLFDPIVYETLGGFGNVHRPINFLPAHALETSGPFSDNNKERGIFHPFVKFMLSCIGGVRRQ